MTPAKFLSEAKACAFSMPTARHTLTLSPAKSALLPATPIQPTPEQSRTRLVQTRAEADEALGIVDAAIHHAHKSVRSEKKTGTGWM